MVGAKHYSVFAERNLFFDAITERHTGILNDHRICSRAARKYLLKSSIITPSSRRMMEAHMADVINLKRFKKRSEREQSAKQAEANRARFGRTKAERALDERRKDRAGDLLDQHKLDDGDAS
jgi:hypothetical protein